VSSMLERMASSSLFGSIEGQLLIASRDKADCLLEAIDVIVQTLNQRVPGVISCCILERVGRKHF
jgi:hypothetical protein